jgi:hypothetical protein
MPDSSPHGVRYLDLADYLYLAGAALDATPQLDQAPAPLRSSGG